MELVDIIPEFNLYEEYWKIYTKNDAIEPLYIAMESRITAPLPILTLAPITECST